MRSFFLALFFLASSSAFADLVVTHNPDGSVTVSGTGSGSQGVVTNYLGCCTNCVNVSPAEMESYKAQISAVISEASINISTAKSSISNSLEYINNLVDQINTFRHYDGSFKIGSADLVARTNFIFNVLDGIQKDMCLQNWNSQTLTISYRSMNVCGYANGIYDYGQVVLSNLDPTINYLNIVSDDVDALELRLDTIKDIVDDISVTACTGCEDDDSGGGSSCDTGDCPCEEQLNAIKDYVDHIDDNLSEQLDFINDEYKDFLERADNYARIVSRSLYQNGTIRVDDGRNSWTNVYVTGSSNLYEYDKSNVLQRIELLLYGLAFPTVSSNLSSIARSPTSEVRTFTDNVAANADNFKGSTDDLKDDVEGLRDKLNALFRAMNFFGNARLRPFALNDPFEAFGYDFEITTPKIDSLTYLQTLVSKCMQIFYIAVGSIFCIWFWYVFISFAYRIVMYVFHFLNTALS